LTLWRVPARFAPETGHGAKLRKLVTRPRHVKRQRRESPVLTPLRLILGPSRLDTGPARRHHTPSAGVDFHCLRHTFGTTLAQKGAHPKTLMSLMDHSDINLTMRLYTHSFPEDEASATDRLPDLGGTGNSQAEGSRSREEKRAG